MAIKKIGNKYPIDIIKTVKRPYECSNKECEYSTEKSQDDFENNICPWCGKQLKIMSVHDCRYLED
jgi:Zn finger protein HypA/HybF involved in hydrogenase expression